MDMSIDEVQAFHIYLHRCEDVRSIEITDKKLGEGHTAKREVTVGNITITMFEKDKEGV
jgi:hypothetical protein